MIAFDVDVEEQEDVGEWQKRGDEGEEELDEAAAMRRAAVGRTG